MEQQERDPVVDQNDLNSGTKISDEEDRILTDVYYNLRSPVAFSGMQKIYKFLKMKGVDSIKPRKLKVWLSRQEPYTSHHPTRRRFQRP